MRLGAYILFVFVVVIYCVGLVGGADGAIATLRDHVGPKRWSFLIYFSSINTVRFN